MRALQSTFQDTELDFIQARAVVTVDGFDIVITIKPSEEIPIEFPVLIKPSLTVELVKKDLDLYLEDIDIARAA